jgi:hypothetical protein
MGTRMGFSVVEATSYGSSRKAAKNTARLIGN